MTHATVEGLRPTAERVLAHVRALRPEMLELLEALTAIESPTDRPETQGPVKKRLARELTVVGHRVRTTPGRRSGGALLAVPEGRRRGRPFQAIVGHCDTVWPLGTLDSMPVALEDGRLNGPGVFDMKAGLVNAIFALRALRDLAIQPPADPVVFVNSDEEVGSPESRHLVALLARGAARAFVLEPSYGPEGRLKTARKGIGSYRIVANGRAAHAGLDPGSGASAILEMARVIEALHGLGDPGRGTTVNVGVVGGGLRSNVVAPEAHALVDVRVLTAEDADRLHDAIESLRPTVPGVTLTVEAGRRIPPLERTTRNVRLWERARELAELLGIELDQATVGGGSDGNTTSLHTATLDGLGAVGDGAHAAHEHVLVDQTFDRCALLVMLLAAPLDGVGP